MKFLFGKKSELAASSTAKALGKVPANAGKSSAASPVPKGKQQMMTGLIFVSASFAGAILILYLMVHAQSAKDRQLRDMKQDLQLAKTEKDLFNIKVQQLETEVGRVIDLDKVMSASEKIHGADEATRKQGSMWINRKTKTCMVTLGALNGVNKGSRLDVYDGEEKFATVKIVSALDVVSYAQPISKDIKDFKKDYYAVKTE